MPKYSNTRIETGTGAIESAFTPETAQPADTNTPAVANEKTAGFTATNPVYAVPDANTSQFSFVTVNPEPGLKGDRVLVAGSGILITDTGPNQTVVISVNDAALVVAGSTTIQASGLPVGTRPTINYIAGSSIVLNATDDLVNNRINIELSARSPQSVTFVGVSGGAGIVATGGPITTSGTINIQLALTGVVSGRYNRVIVDQYGRVVFGETIGYITEASANTAYQRLGSLSALSQFNNDTGYATLTQVNTLVNNLSALSRFNNDQGFVSAAQFQVGGLIEMTQIGLGPNRIIRFSAAPASFTTFVEQTPLGAGITVITGVSGGDEILHRPITGAGGVKVYVSGPAIYVSARAAPINVTELVNDAGYLTEASANTIYTRIGSLSALSQFTNNVGYITGVTTSALGGGQNIVANVSGGKEILFKSLRAAGGVKISAGFTELTISARPSPVNITELVNDAGFITQSSANAAYQPLGSLSALSQFTNNVGYITQSSANAAYQLLGSLSALSQFTNNQGFVSAAQFLAGGIINITVSGNEIRVSAAGNDAETDRITGYGNTNYVIASAPNNSVTIGTNNQTVVTITSAGNVGIGTTTPNSKLEIRDTTTDSSMLQMTTGTTGLSADSGVILGIPTSSVDFVINNQETGNIRISTGGVERLVITPVGDVGIGTDSPTEKFEVEGFGKFGGVIVSSQGTSYALPLSAGNPNQVLSTNGIGGTHWSTITGGGIVSVELTSGGIKVSAAPGTFTTTVTTSALGGGEPIVAGVSGGNEILHRTLIAGGGINISGTTGTVLISAVPAPTLLSQLTNDAGYIQTIVVSATGGSEEIVASNIGNEIVFKTIKGTGIIDVTTSGGVIKISAQSVAGVNISTSALGVGESIIVGISGGELFHRSITVGGGITLSASPIEINLSANIPVALSDLTNDMGFIATVSSTGGNESLISIVSGSEVVFKTVKGGGIIDITTSGGAIKVSGPAGTFSTVVTTSALGVGENIVSTVSGGNEIVFKTIRGGGNVEVTTVGNEIIVSAATGAGSGLVTVQASGSTLSSSIDTLNFVNAYGTKDGDQLVITTLGNIATLTAHIPQQFNFRVNAGASTGVDDTNPIDLATLPTGWTVASATSTTVTLRHNMAKRPRHVTFQGWTIATGYRLFGGGATVFAFQPPGSGDNQIRINIGSPAAALSENNGHYIIELLY